MRKLQPMLPVATLGLVALMAGCAGDATPFASLQNDLQALKERVAKLEAQQPAIKGESATPVKAGWRSLGNWKNLRKSMAAAEVRALLGEPSRVMDGPIVFWFYPNDGRVALINEQVNSWTDPP